MISKYFNSYFLNSILLLILSFNYLYSGDATWLGGVAPWSDDASWNITSGVGYPNGATDVATFITDGTSTISESITIQTLSSGVNNVNLMQTDGGSLNFTSATSTITGGDLTGTNIPIILGANSNLTVDTVAGKVNLKGDSSLSGPSTAALTVSGSGEFLSRGVNLDGLTTVTGAGTLFYSQLLRATHSGDVNIDAGAIFAISLQPVTGDPWPVVTTAIYSGQLTGTGSFFITSGQTFNNGQVRIRVNGDSTAFAGTTDVFGGNLELNGILGGASVTLNDGFSFVSGGGSLLGALIADQGRTAPGSVLGNSGSVLTVGSYTQSANASFYINITPTSTTRLDVTNTATLDGTFALNPTAGIYYINDTFTVLTAGTIVGQFASFVEAHPLDFQLIYNPTSVQVQVLGTTVVTPVALNSLQGNSASVGNYMFTDSNVVTYSEDSIDVANAMLANSPGGFEDSLIRVSPLASASIPVSTLQNNLQMAIVLDKQFQKKVNSTRGSKTSRNKDDTTLCYSNPETGFFIEPIGVFYRQEQTGGPLTNEGQVPFNSYTYGAGTGWEQVLADHFVVEGGVGYTHSNLQWLQDFGKAKWSTIYFAPFLGWFNEKAFVNFMAMGAVNIIDTARRISFGTIQRKARSHYLSYDLLLRLNGGARVPLGKIGWFDEKLSANLWFQPEATLNYLTVFTDSYKENGAASLNLQVKRSTTYIMQPNFKSKIVQEFKTEKFCYSPVIYLGWLANIMLETESISARFTSVPNRIFFNIDGYSGTVNQLILGTEFLIQKFDKFEFTGAFEVDMLSKFEVYIAKIKFQWLF